MDLEIYERELLKEYKMDDVGTNDCESCEDCKTAYYKRAMSPVLYKEYRATRHIRCTNKLRTTSHTHIH